METPLSSTRRITRSQTLAALNNQENAHIPRKSDDIEKSATKPRKGNVLIDITNDSPIAGVAMETPTSSILKKRCSRATRTPGSGEALLRGQVKTLLQKVEEEAELSKIPIETRHVFSLKALVNSPIGGILVAPTPANTPLIGNHDNAVPSIVVEQLVSQVEKIEESVESEKSLITRSLLLDFYEKSEVSSDSSEFTSVQTYKGVSDDDASSVWSIQANASEVEEVGEWEDGEYDGEKADDQEDLINELCDGLSNISMNGKKMAKFEGKHTRFVYNSDDEIVEVEEVGSVHS